jgi:hypothetical protein
VDPCFLSAAFAALLALFSGRSFASSAFFSAALLAAASADVTVLALACCFFYSRIALSFTIKAALYNASVMLSD